MQSGWLGLLQRCSHFFPCSTGHMNHAPVVSGPRIEGPMPFPKANCRLGALPLLFPDPLGSLCQTPLARASCLRFLPGPRFPLFYKSSDSPTPRSGVHAAGARLTRQLKAPPRTGFFTHLRRFEAPLLVGAARGRQT